MPLVEVNLVNFHSDFPVSRASIIDYCRKIVGRLKEKDSASLSLVFIGSAKIKQLNKKWRRKNQATTILTFCDLLEGDSYGSIFDGQKHLGDIFICPAEIKKRAAEDKEPYRDLLKKLLIHGILHLYGYSHEDDKDSKKMELKEAQLFRIINSNSRN